jgi:hypothetical protein
MRRVFPLWAVVLATFVVGTSVYGAMHFFSPIPYWDQWDGYVGFYRSFKDGPLDALWVPHMEHRIVLSRILFILDIVVFGGWNIFTVAVNYLIIFFVAVIILFQCSNARSNKYSLWLVGGLTFGFLFLWCQNENLKWGFQSQGLAVYLFAFCAFAIFSGDNNRKWRLFWALMFSLVSVVSMGNGIAAFGVMIVQAALQRRPLRESFVVAIVGVVAAAIYFHGYVKPVLPVDPATAQIAVPRLKFLLLFLGNPVFYAKPNLVLCAGVGAIFLGVCSLTFWTLFRRGATSRYQSFLVAILCMVLIAAAGAANGRWMLGLQFATSSRYTTPMVIGYLALVLLLLDLATTQRVRAGVAFVSLLLLSAVAGYQKQAYADNGYLYDWKLAVLGQKIGLDHPVFDARIYPASAHDVYADNANFAASQGIGPYGRGWLHDAGMVKFDAGLVDPALCVGYVDSVTPDDVGEVAHGWAFSRDGGADSLLILLVDSAGSTVGYGVTGMNRPDVRKAIKGAPRSSGWTGFARHGDDALNAYVYTAGKFCPLRKVN